MGSRQYTLMHKNIKVVDFKLDAGDIIEIDDTYDMEHPGQPFRPERRAGDLRGIR